MTVTANINF